MPAQPPKAPRPPKAVVFDVGNVLFEWNPDRVYAEFMPDPAERAAFRARTGIDAANLAGDRHGDLAAAIEACAEASPEDAHLIRLWRDRWEDMFGPEIGVATHVLKRCTTLPGLRVAALTNFAADTWAFARDRNPALRLFHVEVVSGRLGTVKPEPEIYRVVEQRLSLLGPDILFTDDKPENVAAARARGWRAHLFRDGWALQRALRAEGLPV